MVLHDASRATTAGEAKKTFATVDIGAVIKVEQDNLDRLLAEEIRSLQARAHIDSDLALLELADNDQSVARHYDRLLANVAELFGATEFGAIVKRRFEQIDLGANRTTALHERRALTAFGITPPECGASMPEFAALPGANKLNAAFLNLARRAYEGLSTACARQIAPTPEQAQAGGALRLAQDAAKKAREDLTSKRDQAEKAQKALDGARAEYAQALKARQQAGEAGAAAKKDLEDKAKAILGNLDKLQDASPALADREKTGALVDVLTAVAGGKVDLTDKALAPALIIAKQVPSLVGTIEEIEALRSAPTVSNLVIALNHQVLAAELDARLASILEEEVILQEGKVRMLENAAGLWRTFNDQLCNLVLIGSGAEHPSTACGTITFEPKAETGKEQVACKITLLKGEQKQEQTVANCVLSRSWKALFGDTQLRSAARRALYEATVAYLNARIAGNMVYEFDFKVVNLKHRASLALRETALRQWNNVIAAPVDQLDAYYASGIKPAELADLLVKALGLTAIAIGVSK